MSLNLVPKIRVFFEADTMKQVNIDGAFLMFMVQGWWRVVLIQGLLELANIPFVGSKLHIFSHLYG